MAKEKKKEPLQKKLSFEQSVQETQKPQETPKPSEQFDWSGLLVPNIDKFIRFVLIVAISIASFGLFVYMREISLDVVFSALMGSKLLLFLLVCYCFACYTAARKISIPVTAALVLVPEVIILIFLVLRLPPPQKPPIL
jgi:hypothetical protein